MNDFVQFNDWWSDKYRFKIGEGIRYFSAKIALNLLLQRGGNTIVETGTTRALNDFEGAGMATIFFGDFAKRYGKHLYTVDILPEAIELSKGLTEEFKDNITYITGDSVTFLKSFQSKIDLLYLDSLDCPVDDNKNNPDLIASQNHQLNELKAAWDKLSDTSIVLLDDNKHSNGGKCTLSKEYLVEKGWTCILDDYQSLWVK